MDFEKKGETHKQFKAFIRRDIHWISELKKHFPPYRLCKVCRVKSCIKDCGINFSYNGPQLAAWLIL